MPHPRSEPLAGHGRALRMAESLLLFASLAALLCAASRDLGLTWDETSYFTFSDGVRAWFAQGLPLDQTSLTRSWAYDYFNPHPPFTKILSALFAGPATALVGFPVGYRMGHLLWTAAGLTLAYRMLAAAFGRGRAAVGLAFVLFQPRLFGEWIIGTTDGPVALAWLLIPLLAWKILEAAPQERRFWRALFIFIAGAAAASKITGLLVLFPVAGYFLRRRQWRETAWLAVAAAWALAFVVMVSPDRWRTPWSCALEYLLYPFTRNVPITTFYLGKAYLASPPWHYLDVMSWFTFPPLLWAFLPLAALAWRRQRGLAEALLFPVMFWIALGHWPATPKHDVVREFVGLYPALGLLAWLGWQSLLDYWQEKTVGRRRRAGILLLALAPLLLAGALLRAHPFELSYYNVFAGGLPGAEKRGLEMTYYFETLGPDFLREVNRIVEPGKSLGINPYWPDLLDVDQKHGLLRSDMTISFDKRGGADYVLLFRRRSALEDSRYVAAPALAEVSRDGVSLTKLVRNSP